MSAPRPGSLRANVLDCLRSWPGIRPIEIAEELGQNADAVRYALYQLRKRKLAPPARAEAP
jgi:predicted transcriptional regulator